MKKNEIFQYMDIHFFLKDYFELRKAGDLKFSYGVWAKELGFNNRVLLRMLVVGKRRLTLKNREIFLKYFQFTENEKQYFNYLVDYSQATDQEKKAIIGKSMMQFLKHFHQQKTITPDSALTKVHLGPLILMVLNIEKLDRTLEGLALFFGVRAEILAESLQQLIFEELIEFDGYQYKTKVARFKIDDDFGNKGLRDFHNFIAEKSMAAQSLATDSRRYRSLLLYMDKNDYAQASILYNEFAEKIMTLFGSHDANGKMLYTIYNSIFPIIPMAPVDSEL